MAIRTDRTPPPAHARMSFAFSLGEIMKRSGHLPMPDLAYQDPVFMESKPARPLRILAEYLDPLTRLRRAGIADTIVMFGSARVHPRDVAQIRLRQVQRAARGRRT